MKGWGAVRNGLGGIVLGSAALFAFGTAAYRSATFESPNVRTLRITHWQLEAGFREALDDLIREYERARLERFRDRIRIVQIPVSERGYAQYVNTGLIGGIAPDIIERGKARTAEDAGAVARFFLPLSRPLAAPNPYNEGTPLEGVPWRETFVDGMSSCYDQALGDYYHVPFSMFTMRIYYNRDLYRKAVGRDTEPRDYSEFIEDCRAIRAHGGRTGGALAPIAGSKAQATMFRVNFERTFLFGMIPAADENRDGSADAFETYRAYRRGGWSFDSPALQAAWTCMAEISGFFQPGWLAAQRDDAVFMFAQERAVMYASGSWDATSIIEQVGDRFEVGIMDFPLPIGHPIYGRFVRGPPTEAHIAGGIPWAINSRTRHAELCVDFLRFCTTRERNERFNRAITWIPVVRGADLSERLRAFRPRIRGFTGGFAYGISSPVRLIGEGHLWTLYSGDLSPVEYARRLAEVYERSGRDGYVEALDKAALRGRDLHRLLAVQQVLALRAGDEAARAVHEDRALHLLQGVQSVRNGVAFQALRLAELEAEEAR